MEIVDSVDQWLNLVFRKWTAPIKAKFIRLEF